METTSAFSTELKLQLALLQVNNVLTLLQENEYGKYMTEKLYAVKIEIERQITNLTNTKTSSKIKE